MMGIYWGGDKAKLKKKSRYFWHVLIAMIPSSLEINDLT